MGYFIHEDQPAGLPLANVDQLNDVNITSPANKDVLAYDATSQKWVNDSSINSALEHLFKTVSFTHSTTVSVSAQSTTTIVINTYSVPSGYTPVALITGSSGNTGISIEGWGVTNNQLYFRVWNSRNSARDAQPSADVLFVKSSLF